jgi:hypothetical protein
MTTIFTASCTDLDNFDECKFDTDKCFDANQFEIYLRRFVFLPISCKKQVPKFSFKTKTVRQTEFLLDIYVRKPKNLEHETLRVQMKNKNHLSDEGWLLIVDWLKPLGFIEVSIFCELVEIEINGILSMYKHVSVANDSMRRKNKFGNHKEFVVKLVLTDSRIESFVEVYLSRKKSKVRIEFESAPIGFLKMTVGSMDNFSEQLATINLFMDPLIEELKSNKFHWLSTLAPHATDCVISDPRNDPADAAALFWDTNRSDKFYKFEVAAAEHDGKGLDHMTPADVNYWSNIIEESAAPAGVQQKCMAEFEKTMSHSQPIMCCSSCGCRLMESMKFVSMDDLLVLELKDPIEIAAYNTIPNLYKAVHNVFQYKTKLLRVHERFLLDVPVGATPAGDVVLFKFTI